MLLLTASFALSLGPHTMLGIATLSSQGNQPSDIRKITVDELKPQQCPWAKGSPSLIQGELKGKSTCFHSEYYSPNSSAYGRFYNSSIPVSSSDTGHMFNFMVPSHGFWFACTTGLKPCINLVILVDLLPQVYYFLGEGGLDHIFSRGKCPRALPAILISALVGLR